MGQAALIKAKSRDVTFTGTNSIYVSLVIARSYESVFGGGNKAKSNKLIGSELTEGSLTIVADKPN